MTDIFRNGTQYTCGSVIQNGVEYEFSDSSSCDEEIYKANMEANVFVPNKLLSPNYYSDSNGTPSGNYYSWDGMINDTTFMFFKICMGTTSSSVDDNFCRMYLTKQFKHDLEESGYIERSGNYSGLTVHNGNTFITNGTGLYTSLMESCYAYSSSSNYQKFVSIVDYNSNGDTRTVLEERLSDGTSESMQNILNELTPIYEAHIADLTAQYGEAVPPLNTVTQGFVSGGSSNRYVSYLDLSKIEVIVPPIQDENYIDLTTNGACTLPINSTVCYTIDGSESGTYTETSISIPAGSHTVRIIPYNVIPGWAAGFKLRTGVTSIVHDAPFSAYNVSTTTVSDNYKKEFAKGCTTLTSVPAETCTIPNTVTTVGNNYMYSMFEGCTSLTNVPFGESELPNSVTSIGNNYMYSMFKGCTALTTVSNTKLGDGVTSVGHYFKAYQFQNCTSLLNSQDEDMPYSLQTIGKYYMTQQYSGCSAMTTAGDEVITNSLVSIGENGRYRQYYKCTSLLKSANEVTKSGGTASELLTIGNAYKKNQYEGCTSITQTGTESMPNVPIAIGNEYKRTQFSGCTALSTLSNEVISNSVVSIGTYYRAEQYPTGANISTTAKEVATGTNSQLGTTIGDYYKYRQYYNNDYIVTAGEEVLPGNTVSIGNYYRQDMYRGCDNLTNTALEFMPNSVTSIGNYFRYYQYEGIHASSLPPEALSSGITTIGSNFRAYQFYNCTAITNITGWKDANVGGSNYRYYQFYNCNTNKTVKVLTDVGYSAQSNTLNNTYVSEVQVPTAYLSNFIDTTTVYPRRLINDNKFVGY